RVADLLQQLHALHLRRHAAEDLLEARGPRRDPRVVGRVDPARLVGGHPRVRPVAVDRLRDAIPLRTTTELRVIDTVAARAHAAGVVAREVALRAGAALPHTLPARHRSRDHGDVLAAAR